MVKSGGKKVRAWNRRGIPGLRAKKNIQGFKSRTVTPKRGGSGLQARRPAPWRRALACGSFSLSFSLFYLFSYIRKIFLNFEKLLQALPRRVQGSRSGAPSVEEHPPGRGGRGRGIFDAGKALQHPFVF